jgi:hypothetical protein
VTVPHHSRALTRATLSSILNQAGPSPDKFLKLALAEFRLSKQFIGIRRIHIQSQIVLAPR